MPHKPQKVYVVLGIFLGFRGRAKTFQEITGGFIGYQKGFRDFRGVSGVLIGVLKGQVKGLQGPFSGSQGISGGVGRLLSDFSDISRSFRDLIRRS